MKKTTISRRLRLVAATLLSVALLVPATSAAAPTNIDSLRAELAKINAEFKKAGKQYDAAYWELDETEAHIAKARVEIADRQTELAESRVVLGKRVAAWYRSDDVGLLGFVLGSEDFQDFVTRLDAMQRIGSADAAVIDHTQGLIQELEEREIELAEAQEQQAKRVREFEKRRDDLQKRLKGKQAEYDRVQAELAAAERARQSRQTANTRGAAPAPSRGGAALPPGPNGMVFPVAGPNYYSDTWGASRGGGRRRHKGTDIMAATGVPVVATMSGTVSASNGKTSGLYLRLQADNGWSFHYMHLNTISVRSGRVSAGQTIGTVGYTGNASASAPHLHFEIHLPGRGAVNPYPYLRQM